MYGKVRELIGEQDFIPFRFLVRYHYLETVLYYNRFSYYDPPCELVKEYPYYKAIRQIESLGEIGQVLKVVPFNKDKL